MMHQGRENHPCLFLLAWRPPAGGNGTASGARLLHLPARDGRFGLGAGSAPKRRRRPTSRPNRRVGWLPTKRPEARRGLGGEPLAVGLHRAVAGELAALGLYETGLDALGGQLP
jgi:hypothetical protein